MSRPSTILFLILAAACGGEATVVNNGGPADAGADGVVEGPADLGGRDTSDPVEAPDLGSDVPTPTDVGGVAMTPADVDPCVNADCWDTSLGGPPCSIASKNEDFSSGNYNVHEYASVSWDGAATAITLTKGAGDWEPVLALVAKDGTTLFDGTIGLQREGLDVRATSGSQVVVSTDAPMGIDVYVTSRAVLDSNFADRIPTDATYTVTIDSDCGGARVACTVNGNDVREPACGWLHYVGRRVVPRLPGTREERIDAAGVVAWWSLKEGVLFLDNPVVYSNCNFPDGDARIGPLEECVPNRAWQVGLSAVQVPYHTDAEVEAAAQAAYPELAIEEVLRLTAIEAQLDATSVDAVVGSSGMLRRSWLLRNSPTGFVIEEPVVRGECVNDSRSWCYGTGWDTTRLYAPNRTAALGAIEDVKALLAQVAP